MNRRAFLKSLVWSPTTGIVLMKNAELGAQAPKPAVKPLIRQLDHILAQSGDPKSLYEFLTETLQLPVAWTIGDTAGYISGGVGIGNTNIEIFRPADWKSPAGELHSAARFTGIAFEPDHLSECIPELKARGLAASPQEPFISKLPNGSKGPLWTTVALPQLSGPKLAVFLYEYNPDFLNIFIRRQQVANRLLLRQGGPLGVKSVREIVVGTTNIARTGSLWRKLFMPVGASTADVWQAGGGPAVHLVPAGEDQILRIVCRVTSLKAARSFLEQKHIFGTVTARDISINPSAVQGLQISLTER